MRKIRNVITIFLLVSLCAGLGWPANSGSAADHRVSVTLPTFPVSLNGHVVDNSMRMYPLLVYKDITYVPMTWYDSRLLGLESSWSPQDGLSVKQTGVIGKYEPYLSKSRNGSNLTANVVEGKVRINDVIIDNQSEPYPLLSFRNVTYFPLTWRFAHEMFKWDYEWDKWSGLQITTNHPKLMETGLPLDAGSNGIALYKGNYYYVKSEGSINRIFRAPENNPKYAKEVHQYDGTYFDGIDLGVGFHIIDDKLWMYYPIGYSVYHFLLNEEGEIQQEYKRLRSFLDFRETTIGRLVVNVGLPDEGKGNVHIVKEDGSKYQIGDPKVTSYGQSTSKNGFTPTTVIGENVYVLLEQEAPTPFVLYQIDLKTDETLPLISGVEWFEIGKDKIYYTLENNKMLYMAELDGSSNKLISDHPVSWFDFIGNHVFYTTKDEAGKLVLYRAEEEGQDTELATVKAVTVAHDQLFVILEDKSQYGALILDAEGEILWRIAEPISKTYASDEGWIVQSARDKRVLILH